MNGRTPTEKPTATKVMIHQHVLLFPMLSLEGLLRKIGSLNHFLRQHQGGRYVHTTWQNQIPPWHGYHDLLATALG